MPMTDEKLPQRTDATMSRRTFLEWAAVMGGTAALTGVVSTSALASDASAGADAADAPQPPAAEPFEYDSMAWGGCHVNCGSRCPLKMYVKDDTVVRVGVDDDGGDIFGPGEIYQMRSCVRGRTNRQRLYNDSRIQTPLRRVPEPSVARASSRPSPGTRPSTRSPAP